MNNINSRRSFLSSLAILSAGTVFAGSPIKLLSTKEDNIEVEKIWDAYVKKAGASVFLNLTAVNLPVNHTEVKGHTNKKGTILNFSKENLLAQPTWIYWGRDTSKPNDVIINVYENKHPFKRLAALNKYQLNALLNFTNKTTNDNLLLAICVQNNHQNKLEPRLIINTSIKKSKQIQDICLYKNETVILREKLFLNV